MSDQHRVDAARTRRYSASLRRRPHALPPALVLAMGLAGPAVAAEPRTLDLPGALALARANSPTLDAARRRVAEARGELTGASVLVVENPELAVGAGRRQFDPGETGDDLALEAGLSQRLEIGGQRGHRIDRARSGVASAQAETDAVARALDLAVATGLWEALAAAERTSIAGQHEAPARELLGIALARFERGAATPVEVNGARIRLAEAERRRAKMAGLGEQTTEGSTPRATHPRVTLFACPFAADLCVFGGTSHLRGLLGEADHPLGVGRHGGAVARRPRVLGRIAAGPAPAHPRRAPDR